MLTQLQETAQVYNFSNIRFAQPPVGDLRFAAPVLPSGRNPDVQDGSVGAICPQAAPAWLLVAEQFAASYVAGNGSEFNVTLAEQQAELYLQNAPPSQPDPRTTEDCLFLDVFAPKNVFDNANNRHRKRWGGGAPVLVW